MVQEFLSKNKPGKTVFITVRYLIHSEELFEIGGMHHLMGRIWDLRGNMHLSITIKIVQCPDMCNLWSNHMLKPPYVKNFPSIFVVSRQLMPLPYHTHNMQIKCYPRRSSVIHRSLCLSSPEGLEGCHLSQKPHTPFWLHTIQLHTKTYWILIH